MIRNKTPLLVICIAPLCFTLTALADDLPKLESILAGHLEARGGLKKLNAIKTVKMTGKTVMGGGMEAPLSIAFKDPGKVRIEFTFQGMTGIQAYDGNTGWFVMPFMGKIDPEKMAPDQIDGIKDQADFLGPLVNSEKKGHKIELVGKDEVEGSETFKLKVTKKNGDVEYHFLDAEYFLTIQKKGKREFQGTEMDFQVSYSDFKEVDGLVFPHATESGGMGSMVIEKIEVNADIPDSQFTMPEAKKETTDESAKEAKPEKPSDEKTPEEDK